MSLVGVFLVVVNLVTLLCANEHELVNETLVNEGNLLAKCTNSEKKINALSFKILQVADLHYTSHSSYSCRDPPLGSVSCSEANMTQFLNSLFDVEKPDLVVFTGDQVMATDLGLTASEVKSAIYDFSEVAINRSIPWAIVFGNHDEGVSYS